MLDAIRRFATDPLVAFSLILVGLALTVFGLYLARRYKPRRRLAVTSWNNTDFLSAADLRGTPIQILHQGKAVPGLAQLWFTLKNNGTEVLKPEDFHHVPTVQFFGDVEVLHAEARASAGHIEPRILSDKPSELKAEFKFLEPRDSISIRVVYGSATAVNGAVSAKVIGGNQLRSEFRTNRQYDAYRESKLLGKTVYMFIGVGLFAAGSRADDWLRAKYVISGVPTFVTKTLIALIAFVIALRIGLTIQRKREAARVRELIREGYLDPATEDDLLSPRP